MILVTGAAGFIGFHTAQRLLDRGQSVLGVDKLDDSYDPSLKRARLSILNGYTKFRFAYIDLSDSQATEELFQGWNFSGVCHLAAQSGNRNKSFDAYHKSNIEGFNNLMESACNAQVANFVYASSYSVYGNNPHVPCTETDPLDMPASLYAASKRANEQQAFLYHQKFNFPSTGLRFFTVYGPWGRPDMAYFKFTQALLEGKEITIYNQGCLERDFVYIDDLVDGIISALDNIYPMAIFNLGSAHPVSLEELISVLERLTEKKARKKYICEPIDEAPQIWADINKSQEMLHFIPHIELEEGLANFVKWYRKQYRV